MRLIEWLNALPEVKAVLKADFEGVAISEMNLSQWRNGGFLDWQARRDARELIDEWESPQSTVLSPQDFEVHTNLNPSRVRFGSTLEISGNPAAMRSA